MLEMQSCALCSREFQKRSLTRHHCRPREEGGGQDDIAMICSQCHGMVHATFTNATLATAYPTIARLREAPELEAFLRWVRKQPATRRKRNEPRKRKL